MNGFARNLLAMIELEMRRIKHDRTELYSRAVQPILWIVVYGPIMGSVRAIPTGGIPYTDYITPGVLIQSTTFISIFYGLTIVWERESGILKKLLVAPASRYSIVMGRALASGIRAIFQALIIIPVALLIGVRFIPSILNLTMAFAVIFIASGGFAAISILIASFMKTRERFMGIGQAITMPLFFASNALYPVSMMPQIMQWIAHFNPMSYVVDAVRSLMITGNLANLPIDLAAIAIFDTVMFIIASINFSRIIE
ncbi:MAG: ABC transporter permease [archaeon YNP-LCB-024-027]|jgi:ABC-2 type transport system permease protein|nr:ABC transporter permease [Candidatus Culexarchaeum yellowstonense]